MIPRIVIPESPGCPVRWFGGFAVVELPPGRNFLTAPALAGELCAALDEAAPDDVLPVHASAAEAVATADGLARRGDREYLAVAGYVYDDFK
jgi:hypothetical protein